MKTYNVKFACGHEGTINVSKGEYWKVENADRYLCYKCYKKAQENRQKWENEEAQKEFIEAGYPELTGKPSDVASAIRIRKSWINFYNEVKDNEDEQKYVALLKETLNKENTNLYIKIGGYEDKIIDYIVSLADGEEKK
jgi:pyruvate-formate lyase